MLINLALGLATMVACLLLQALLIAAAIRYYRGHERSLRADSFRTNAAIITGVMLLLTAGNLAQVAAWALLFRLLGEFTHFAEAFYHSAVNFATLGYGDIVMSDRHKLLGPLEAINGALMIGASTATLIVALQAAFQQLALSRTH